MYFQKLLYIFFSVLALNISFFSTNDLNAKAFFVDQVEISEKLENNFNKDALIDRGFQKAFEDLMYTIVKSKDFNKTKQISLNEIKTMIETFSIKQENFVNNAYKLNLGVSFNKKKIFNFLESKNIFPAQIVEEKFLFIPIIIDQSNTDLLMYSNNSIYQSWLEFDNKNYLIEYVLPTEDLEDLNLIKKNYLELENYDFEKIIEKYYLKHSIVALFFKDNNQLKILSKIYLKDKKVIKSNSFNNIDLNNRDNRERLIKNLKIIYEDFWKDNNLINTSIKLPLLIQIENRDLSLTSRFEETLNTVDLISTYKVKKFNKDNVFYEVIFNGTPKNFINIMKDRNYEFDTQKKTWILK